MGMGVYGEKDFWKRYTVKDAGNYASKPTRRQKAYATIIHFTRHFARRSPILKLVIHHHNTRFM